MNSFSIWKIVKSFKKMLLGTKKQTPSYFAYHTVLTLSLDHQKMGKETFNSKNIYIPSYDCRREHFKSSFFPASLKEWSNIDPNKFYQCIQTRSIAFDSPVRKHYFQHLWPRRIEIIYSLTSRF